MKVCIVQEQEEPPYKVVYASRNETPYRILKENNVIYETRDVFLNGIKITNENIVNPISNFRFQEKTVFLSVRKKL